MTLWRDLFITLIPFFFSFDMFGLIFCATLTHLFEIKSEYLLIYRLKHSRVPILHERDLLPCLDLWKNSYDRKRWNFSQMANLYLRYITIRD